MTYFNTNFESGRELATSRKKNAKQDVLILDTFETHRKPLSSFDVLTLSRWPSAAPPPRTSVHRALRTLVKDGKLVKNGSDDMKLGPYGKAVHTWSLSASQKQSELF